MVLNCLHKAIEHVGVRDNREHFEWKPQHTPGNWKVTSSLLQLPVIHFLLETITFLIHIPCPKAYHPVPFPHTIFPTSTLSSLFPIQLPWLLFWFSPVCQMLVIEFLTWFHLPHSLICVSSSSSTGCTSSFSFPPPRAIIGLLLHLFDIQEKSRNFKIYLVSGLGLCSVDSTSCIPMLLFWPLFTDLFQYTVFGSRSVSILYENIKVAASLTKTCQISILSPKICQQINQQTVPCLYPAPVSSFSSIYFSI